MLEKKDLELIEGIITRSLAPIKADVSELKTDVSQLKTDMVEVKTEVAELKADVSQLKTDMVEVKADIVHLKTTTRETQFYMENVLNKNISIIGEGHLDLSRKLDEAIKIDNEKELLQLRVTTLEYDVRQIKRAIALD